MRARVRAERYVLGIRNKAKRQYAAAYMGYLCGLLDHCPVHPKDLSVMGGQAVRLALHVLLDQGERGNK